MLTNKTGEMSVSIDLMGGLGNQLFQIAAAYAYAKRYGLQLILPTDWQHPEERQAIWNGYLDINKWASRSNTWNVPTIYESSFKYNALPPPSHSIVKLSGYFQSSLYFMNIGEEIRELFQPSAELLEICSKTLKDAGAYEPGWIGAHVRRGDYLKAADYHVVCDQKYFKGARAEIDKRIGKRGVCWITEDPEWVYKNLYEEGDKVISNKDPLVDFVCLQHFRDLILSNSSYSWWAAFINPKNHNYRRICAPNRWFGPKGPQDCSTIFEPGWILIDTTSGNLAEHV
jgi:hypothetical protein